MVTSQEEVLGSLDISKRGLDLLVPFLVSLDLSSGGLNSPHGERGFLYKWLR